MQTIPMHDYGFMITPELAPYFMLAADRMAGNELPDVVRHALEDGSFDEKARTLDGGFEYEDYLNPMAAKEAMESAWPHCSLAYVSDFAGDVDTIEIPDPDRPGQTKEIENPLSMSLEDDVVVYQPLKYGPSLFMKCYENPEAIVAEIRGILGLMGVKLPDGFNDDQILRHVVRIYGTTCV